MTVGTSGSGGPAPGGVYNNGNNGTNSSLLVPAGTQGSVSLNGSNQYLTVPYSTTNFDWYTTDYTIEAWIYPTSYKFDGTPAAVLVGNMNAGNTFDYWSFGINSGTGRIGFYYYNGSQQSVNSTDTVPLNTWSQIAMTKTSSGITLFVNGISQGTVAINGSPQSSSGTPLTIGAYNNSYFAGYTSNLRIVKGTAVYTGNYTPSTTPLTAISGTQLLTAQSSSTITDASTNAYTITSYNSAAASSMSPAATTIMAVGGGGGSGDAYAGPSRAGQPGGSGGGGGGATNTGNPRSPVGLATGSPGFGVAGTQGNPGGYAWNPGAPGVGGGGGGAGGVGGSASTACLGGAGGNGITSLITGVSTYYGCGGGGAGNTPTRSPGGAGGGGGLGNGGTATGYGGGGGGGRGGNGDGGPGYPGVIIIWLNVNYYLSLIVMK
jgi:hypothetical protein